MRAGFEGLFAVEKHPDAFSSLEANLASQGPYSFVWPNWLPRKAMPIRTLLKEYRKQLQQLEGKIDLVAGGPPCQGFSAAGRRNPKDPRNSLTNDYLRLVEVVKPRFLLLENVAGFNIAFDTADADANGKSPAGKPYSETVKRKLRKLGYSVFSTTVCSSSFGVPQRRRRYIMFSVRLGDPVLEYVDNHSFDTLIEVFGSIFREEKGLAGNKAPTVSDAIADLRVSGKELIDCTDNDVKGFKQIRYTPPARLSPYLSLMRSGLNGTAPNSLRLPNHRPSTIERFEIVQSICRPGICLSDDEREALGIKKHTITVLNANSVSATVTTLPDDILHYAEPRILTVRELARLQSFPDWFSFMGKYTTGGDRRKKDCPRYTQVGNAVPPLLAEGLGNFIVSLDKAATAPQLD